MPDKHTESDYASLSYKHNRLLSAYNALKQEHNDGEKTWKKIEKKYKDEIDAMRRFLERILAKSPAEISASHGKEYSWSSLPTMELLAKAIAAYDLHNKTRTDLMRSIQAIAEERSQIIEDLTTQYEALKTELDVGSPERRNVKPVSQETMARMNYNLQKSVEDGNTKVELVEEDSDVSAEDVLQYAEMRKAKMLLEAKEQGIHVSPSRIVEQKIQKEVEKATGSILLSVDEIRKQMDDGCWALLTLIGSYGIDNIQDVITKAKEMEDKGEQIGFGSKTYDPSFKESTLRNGIKSLVRLQLLSEVKITLPLGNKNLYRLTDKGIIFYKEGSGGISPTQSQYDWVVANHDNPEHGYGILALAKILEDSGLYESVSTDRKENQIKQQENSYIPDIVAKRKEKSRRGSDVYNYFEYERNTHHTNDFLVKLNKMALVTRTMYIITPNAEAVKGIKAKVDKWIASRPSASKVMNHTVYISTFRTFMSGGADVNNEKAWTYIVPLVPKENPFLPKERSDPDPPTRNAIPKKEGIKFTTSEEFDF